MWKPMSEQEILADIKRTEYYITDNLEEFWNLIKIPPESWKYTGYNSEESFWVIAIWGNQVLLYNDIEEGYNISEYSKHGIIKDPGANQIDLYEIIEAIFQSFQLK